MFIDINQQFMCFFKKLTFLFFLLATTNGFAQSGCTDYQATNFDPFAVTNDGSCTYAITSLPLSFKCFIDSNELKETSGIVNQDNNFWTHVDDANTAIYRIDTISDTVFQKVTINNSSNYDWEDITSDSSHIYVGDVGNNDGNRTNLRFYKVLKSDITPFTTTVNAGRINYSYSDQVNFNVCHNCNFYECEAFFYLNDSIHLFTKGWVNRWTKHYVVSADTGIQVAQFVDSFYVGGLITSAAIQGDSLVVLLGLNFNGGSNCFVWMLNDFSGTKFFSGNKRKFSIGNVYTTGQTEAICFTDTNKGYITNEAIGSVRAQLREFDLNTFLAPAPVVPLITTSVNSVDQNLRACSDSGSTSFTITNVTATGGPDLYFSIGGLPQWISASPISDTVASGDSAVITLSFASGTMSGGTYFTNVPIVSNDPYHAIKNVVCTLSVDSNPCIDFIFASDTCSGIVDFTSNSINTPTSYYWDFGDGDTSTLANPVHPYSANGNYTASLIGCNASGCDTAAWNVQASLSGPIATNCYPVTQTYCCGIGITHLKIDGPSGNVIDNSSSDASVGYEDFTCLNPGSMFTSTPYTLICTTSTSHAEFLRIWLDMNNDGVLQWANEELYRDIDSVAPVHSGTFTIPMLIDNVYGVPLRMRVASDYLYFPDPCTNPQYGQHEDYSISLNFSTVEVNELSGETDFSVYPNPFTHSANIDYTLKQSSTVRIDVINLLGERVALLVDSQKQSPGQYRYQFQEQPQGIYFVKLSVDDTSVIKKIVKTN